MTSPLPAACILAGGRATRLGPRARERPKALIDVAGTPFLFRQLRLLADHGISRVVLLVGHLGEQIEDAVGTSLFGIDITYSRDAPGLSGTLGAIRRALPMLGDRFLVTYGDTYLQIDYRDVVKRWMESGLPGLMTVLHNENQWGRSNAIFNTDRVLAYDKFAPTQAMTWIDYGLGGLVAECLSAVNEEADDLADLYHALAAAGQLFGYEATERFHEIGTPEAVEEATRFFESEDRRRDTIDRGWLDWDDAFRAIAFPKSKSAEVRHEPPH